MSAGCVFSFAFNHSAKLSGRSVAALGNGGESTRSLERQPSNTVRAVRAAGGAIPATSFPGLLFDGRTLDH